MMKNKPPSNKIPMLKCALHTHAQGDPLHHIPYTPKQLVKEAARLKYDFLVITTHRKILFSKSFETYAKKHGILTVPGVEFEINKMHILGINVDHDIYKVDDFEKLRQYRKSHPKALIIAPHPFYPGSVTLKHNLIKHIDLFDAIEESFFYTYRINFNKKAVQIAKQHKKPLVGTSDCHIIEHLDLGYTLVDAPKTISGILNAIKAGKAKPVHKPIGHIKAARIFTEMTLQVFRKK